MARKDNPRHIPVLAQQPEVSERWLAQFKMLEDASRPHAEILRATMDLIDKSLDDRGFSIAAMSPYSIKVPDLHGRDRDTSALRWINRMNIRPGLWTTLATKDTSMGILLHLDQSSGERASLRMIGGASCQAELKCAWIKAALVDLRAGWHPTDLLILEDYDEQPSKADLRLLDEAAGATIRKHIDIHRHHAAMDSLPWPGLRTLAPPEEVNAMTWTADMIAEVARENMLVGLTP